MALNNPAVKSNESPGRKKPSRIPDSAKMTANRPSAPTLRIKRFGSMPIAAITECVVLTR